MRRRLLALVAALFMIVSLAARAWAQEPDAINAALADLSQRLGVPLSLSDLASWQWEQKNFPDTSLGCPKPGLSYAQVMTNGYQILLSYQGVTYDYRASADGGILLLCSPGDQGAVSGTPLPTLGPALEPTPQPPPATTLPPVPTPTSDPRDIITGENAADIQLFTQRALRDTVQEAALLPPPSLDALIVADGQLVYYPGAPVSPDVTPLGNAGFTVLDVIAARHQGVAARFATLEENPDNPGVRLLFVWEIAEGDPLQVTRTSGLELPFVPNALAFSPDGRVLAVSSGDLPERERTGAEAMVWLWDLANGAQVTFDLNAPAADLVFSSDGALLAVSVPGKGIYLWEVTTQAQRALLPGTYGWRGTPSLAFSPDGSTLAAGAEDGTVVAWDLATATELRTLGEPGGDPVLFVTYNPDGSLVAAASAQPDESPFTTGVRLWNPDTGELLSTLADQSEPVKVLGFRDEGRELVAVGTQTWVSWAVY